MTNDILKTFTAEGFSKNSKVCANFQMVFDEGGDVIRQNSLNNLNHLCGWYDWEDPLCTDSRLISALNDLLSNNILLESFLCKYDEGDCFTINYNYPDEVFVFTFSIKSTQC